jgi:hypothetical protein
MGFPWNWTTRCSTMTSDSAVEELVMGCLTVSRHVRTLHRSVVSVKSQFLDWHNQKL